MKNYNKNCIWNEDKRVFHGIKSFCHCYKTPEKNILDYRFNVDEVRLIRKVWQRTRRYKERRTLINSCYAMESLFRCFFYISATNFIVMTHNVFRHCKLQITIHIHIESDSFFFFVQFSISLCSLWEVKRYFYNRRSVSFAVGFLLTIESSSLYIFPILNQKSAHIKWNKAICLCQAYSFHCRQEHFGRQERRYIHVHANMREYFPYLHFDIVPKGCNKSRFL